ncbi:MAG: hypothetical protein KC910_28665 [Candidatus Eremiobacteraeota bacterium]|nr:hypothetical protein [Candidatus Eremiobacteraeota bacterium]
MADGKKKNKHICGECGEEFPHAITLRRHQRKTGHKGSKVVEVAEGGDSGEAPKAAPPKAAPAARQAEPEPESEPEVVEAAEEHEEVEEEAIENGGYEEEEPAPEPVTARTVQVPRAQPAAPRRPRLQIDRKKLSFVGRAVQYLVAYRARKAEDWLKRSAQSTASVMSESLKLAGVLLIILSIPLLGWVAIRLHRSRPVAPPNYSAQAQVNQNQALEARGAVLGFYQAIDRGNFNVAYDLLSQGWRSELPYESFVAGFEQTRAVGCRIENHQTITENQVQVDFVVDMQEADEARTYRGSYLVVRTSSGWRIDSGELKLSRGGAESPSAS